MADDAVTPNVTVGAVESLAGEPEVDSDAGPLPFALTARIRIVYVVPVARFEVDPETVEITIGERRPEPSARVFHVEPSSVEYS